MAKSQLTKKCKSQYYTRRSVILSHVITIFLFTVYSGNAEATLISNHTDRPYLDSRENFLFQWTYPREVLMAEACNLRSVQADGKSHSNGGDQGTEPAEYLSRTNIAAVSPSGRLADRQDSRSWPEARWRTTAMDQVSAEAGDLNRDAGNSTDIFTRLEAIGVRLGNIDRCRNYLRSLLESMMGFTLNLTHEYSSAPFGKTLRTLPKSSDLISFVFRVVGGSMPNNSHSAAVYSEKISKYSFDYTMLNEYRRTLENISDEQEISARPNTAKANTVKANTASAGPAEKKGPSGGQGTGETITLSKLIAEVFSNVYTYILIFTLGTLSLFLRTSMK